MLKSITVKLKLAVCSLQFAAILCPALSVAQSGEWTWMHGKNVTGVTATYGTQTIFHNNNNPPGLYEACQWTDTAGNFWLFGGIDFNGNIYGDLWQYKPSTNQWAWMNGTQNVNDPGYYGTQGVPSLGNVPTNRSHGMATWTDKNNNLWFFGGSTYLQSSSYNDLWKYDIVTGEWTWMKGPNVAGNLGHYGTQGVPDTANLPPHRAECAAAWVDNAGDLWLFGGQRFGNGGVYNDLWRYNIAANTWTWMKGSDLTNRPSTYGTKTIESASNTPGGRAVYTHLKDKNDNLWLFGGFAAGGGLLNDIWRYNPVTNNWAWLGGKNGINAKGVYGTKCMADSANIPGGRFENRACWTDKNGNLWFFGGFVSFSGNTPDVSNELWLYCIESNKWTWVSGDTIPNPVGSWGTVGISSPANKPDGRGGSASWIDKSFGNLYLFGGSRKQFPNSYQDMWRFNIDTTCGTCPEAVLPVAGFTADSLICANDCITFTDTSANATSWIWSFPGGLPSSSTSRNPEVCYFSDGLYDVELIATSYKGSSRITSSNYISVNAAPPTPFISILNANTLHCSTDPAYISYQWYDSTALIPGATDTILVISHSGNYNVKVTGSNGCSIAVGINFVGIKELTASGLQFTVSPNPTGDKLTITGSAKLEAGNWRLEIFNVLGERIYNRKPETLNRKQETVIDVSSISSGIYFIQISNDSKKWIGRFVKE